ncbi:hypothetical protein [Methylobacter svalbardensis]|uniref:hypothetical protein n=1 Tax=Methylobacter svalbardensis TaxID=3080016 RepID=UPI0030EC39A3
MEINFLEVYMEKMQWYINFIFFEVWCKAKGKDYVIEELFSGNEELCEIITELHYSQHKGADFFLAGLQHIFEDFKILENTDIENLKHWYRSNNRVDLLCAKDPSVSPVTYNDIEKLSDKLSHHLKDFFKNLYSQSFLSLTSISSRIGQIENHYTDFISKNASGKCPFCGINNVKGNYHSKREAYDHYLPKGKYPFNSINFRNLAPACNECNSSYKLAQDPLYNAKDPLLPQTGGIRKSFYPYQVNQYTIEFKITLDSHDWNNIQPADIELQTGPDELREELDTWLDVYGIDERYKAKCCTKNDGKYWIEQVLDECQNDGRTPEQIFNTLARQAKLKPYADVNFLKFPFLEACNNKRLFDV